MSKLIDIALSKYGLEETPGKLDNSEILAMAKEAGFKNYKHDATAWCSVFASWVAHKAGYKRPIKIKSRSWLKYGISVKQPKLGDVVVLWRGSPSGSLGHVGFFISKREGTVYLIGGNQSNKVSILSFPLTRVLGYRRLSKL